MGNILDVIKTELSKGKMVMLVTIVDSEGSTPRGKGAMMLVGKEGLISGTIGGGSIEKEAIEEAKVLLEKKENANRHYELKLDGQAEFKMACGGAVDVEFLYIDDISKVSVELPKQNRAVIFGGGHVSRALVKVLSSVEFECVVVENRPEFADLSKFDGVSNVILADYKDIENSIELKDDDYVIIMTHGHVHDLDVLSQVLKRNVSYVGVMGSRKKIAFVNDSLRKEGMDEEKIASVHTPIGLKIGAVTPEEIAVSVAAECIMVRAINRGVDDNKICPSLR